MILIRTSSHSGPWTFAVRVAISSFVVVAFAATARAADPIVFGDVFVSYRKAGYATVRHYDSSMSTLKGTATTGHVGTGAGMAFDGNGDLWVTTYTNDTNDEFVTKFSHVDFLAPPTDCPTGNIGNEDILFDHNCCALVGSTSNGVYTICPNGCTTGCTYVPTQRVDWMDLDYSIQRLFWTHEGQGSDAVLRADVTACPGTVLTPLVPALPSGAGRVGYAVKVVGNNILVVDRLDIQQYDKNSGAFASPASYDAPGHDTFFSMCIGTGGTDLFAVDLIQKDVVKIPLSGGTPTITPMNDPTITMGSVIIAGGYTVGGCSSPYGSVGVNKDLKNTTGQAANGIEILLSGTYTAVSHWDGYAANHFSSFTVSPDPGGNTRLKWSSPNNPVQPGQIAHVGFNVPGSSVLILGVFWTHDSVATGCAHECSTNTHLWGTPGSQVVYKNSCTSCEAVPLYVGGLSVEWHAIEVPLGDLNASTNRHPMRTDSIPDAPILLAPGASASVGVPTSPAGAKFGVIIHKVSTSPTLTGPDVTTDFLQFHVQDVTAVPATSPGGLVVLLLALAMGGTMIALRERNRRWRLHRQL